MDDITFCLSDCQRTDCFRHPSNIQDRTIPHSYADFRETETCPEFAKDINVTSNDCIDRHAAIDALDMIGSVDTDADREYARKVFMSLPSAQPEIIYCKDCVKHNKGHGYYLDGTIIGIKDCCPLVEIRGMAQGHEFDYQYCAYAKRRQDASSR